MELKGRMGCIFCTDGMPRTVAVDIVQQALTDSGLSPELAQAIQKRGCFSRAKSKLQTEGLILEVAKRDDQGRWLWQLSDKYINANKLETKYRAQFWFIPDTLEVGADDPGLKAQIERLFAEYGGLYLANDLMRLVHRVFSECKGLLPLRRHGGVYFVPEIHRPTLEKIMTFLQRIGCVDCVVTNVGTIEEGSLRDKAVVMLVESTQARLKAIQDELKTLESEGNDLKKRRAKGRWNELQEQLQRIRTFANALGVSSQKIIEDASTNEIKLATVASGDLDTIAAMAHAGKLDGEALSKIVKAAYDGDALPIQNTAEVEQPLPTVDIETENAPEAPLIDLIPAEFEVEQEPDAKIA